MTFEYISLMEPTPNMVLGKRKFVTGRGRVVRGRKVSASYANRAKRARIAGRTGYANIMRVSSQVRAISRMIETKEGTHTARNVNMPHNNTYIVQSTAGGDLNPFALTVGTGDPMAQNTGARLGDRISVKGLMIRGFLENSLNRSKVFFRIMLIKCPRGQAPTRTELFKNSSDNKMIDQVNTEKFTIVWQKVMNITTANNAPTIVGATTGQVGGGTPAGIGTRTFKAWIPGRKFGKGGTLQYENNSNLPKFFDYRIVILCYDWYGTPQDTNNVGFLNELYTKLYFKDA